MAEREYYVVRKGIQKPDHLDFPLLTKVLRQLFIEFENFFLFREAIGHSCPYKGKSQGLWGNDIEASIYLKIKMIDIWPIPKNIRTYDEPTLFTVIEFLYDYVSEPQKKHYHDFKNCGWHTSNYDKKKGREIYRARVNEILKNYGRGYELLSTGEIVEIAPSGMETIFQETIQTDDPNNIDTRIKTATSNYRRYGATIDDKKHAIRTLADVLEFLRKEEYKLPSKDDNDLFKIINGFDIRHHNRKQQSEYDKEIWYDWMFYTFLASIYVLLKLRETST